MRVAKRLPVAALIWLASAGVGLAQHEGHSQPRAQSYAERR